MSYVSQNLMPGEELLFRPRYHWIRFFPAALGVPIGIAIAVAGWTLVPPAATGSPDGGVMSFGIAGVGAVIILLSMGAMGWRALSDSFDEFAVTSLRVILKTGVLARNVRQIPLDKVQDVNVRSTLGGRWLSYGDVEIQTMGTDSTVVFPRILNPEQFRNVLFAHARPQAAGAAPVAAAQAPASGGRISVEDRLKEAERLFKSGAISEAEYQEKRQALIREL
jgi:uncharacterized membrane protein YdbT with pleckstrin-like domain